MLNVNKETNGAELTVNLEGRLDTTTAPDLEKDLEGALDGITTLTMNLANLEYISSAGLRILLATQKVMNKQGSMIVKNVSEEVNEIFEVTGFSDILTIE